MGPKTVLLALCMASSLSSPPLPSYSPPCHSLSVSSHRVPPAFVLLHPYGFVIHLSHETMCAQLSYSCILHHPGTISNKHELNKRVNISRSYSLDNITHLIQFWPGKEGYVQASLVLTILRLTAMPFRTNHGTAILGQEVMCHLPLQAFDL